MSCYNNPLPHQSGSIGAGSPCYISLNNPLPEMSESAESHYSSSSPPDRATLKYFGSPICKSFQDTQGSITAGQVVTTTCPASLKCIIGDQCPLQGSLLPVLLLQDQLVHMCAGITAGLHWPSDQLFSKYKSIYNLTIEMLYIVLLDPTQLKSTLRLVRGKAEGGREGGLLGARPTLPQSRITSR